VTSLDGKVFETFALYLWYRLIIAAKKNAKRHYLCAVVKGWRQGKQCTNKKTSIFKLN